MKTLGRIVLRVLLLGTALVLAGLLGAWVYAETRPEPEPATWFETEDGTRVADLGEALPLGLVVPVGDALRPRYMFAPESRFYICYSDVQPEREAYYGERNGAFCVMNSLGMREREELAGPKPDGQTRVLCIGDSFTFGYGLRIEDVWTRLIEQELRQQDDSIRTVNAGACGTLYCDEYALGLRERFHVVDPDLVVVTLCLNDLLPTFGNLVHSQPEPRPSWTEHAVLLADLYDAFLAPDPLAIDPERDLVAELLALPPESYAIIPVAQPVGHAGMWAGGGPQKALDAIGQWCREHDAELLVVIWPYLQGLGPDEHYPFAGIHDRVRDFCTERSIRFHDVLPSLQRQAETRSLWVSDSDQHANETAQRMAAPGIAQAVAEALRGR